MQNQNAKLRLCIAANVVLLVIIVTLITAFRSGQGGYWNYGPSEKFVIVSVTIDTWSKYYWLLAVITVVRITKVIIQEIAHPIIGFNIYNDELFTRAIIPVPSLARTKGSNKCNDYHQENDIRCDT